MPLTSKQKEILHRAIDEARDLGGARYVDEYGLPLDVVSYVALYEDIPMASVARWQVDYEGDTTIQRIVFENKEKFAPFYTFWPNNYLSRLEPYLAPDTQTAYRGNDYYGLYIPKVSGPILDVLQTIWNCSRGTNRYPDADKDDTWHIRDVMHTLVNQLP